MNTALLLMVLLCNTSLALIDKTTGNVLKSRDSVLPFSLAKTALCAVIALIFLPFGSGVISVMGIAVALSAGIFHALSVVLIMHCLRTNPAVYVNLFMASGIILPTCFDWAFVYGRISLWELFFLIGTIFSLSLVLDFKKGNANLKTLTVMFFCYGMLMVMQGAFPKTCENGDRMLFSFVLYGSSALILTVVWLIKGAHGIKFEARLKGLCLVAALLNLAGNILLTTLSAVLPSSLLFPVVHGIKLVAITLLSSVLWKEKLSLKQIIGAFLTIGCICMLGG